MSLSSLIRRTTAVTAAAALLTTGGMASGLFVAPASAAPGDPVITSLAPAGAANVGVSEFAINGTGFVPAADTVQLVPQFTGNGVAAINLTVILSRTTPGDARPVSGPNQLIVSSDLTRRAPGSYKVRVEQKSLPASAVVEYCCFEIASLGAANVLGSVPGVATSSRVLSSTGKALVDVNGDTYATGAKVEFLKLDGTIDPAMAFTVTSYTSATQLQGEYTYAASGQPPFSPGKHFLRVLNTDTSPRYGTTQEFWQPSFQASGVVPNRLGAGATSQIVTITGSGIRAGSKLEIPAGTTSGCTSPADIAITDSQVDTSSTSLTARVTLRDCATPGPRTVGIRGADGGYFEIPGAFTVVGSPTVVQFSPKTLGQGGTFVSTVTGSNFDPVLFPTFTFDEANKITAVTKSVTADGSAAQVEITATPDATVGNHGFTVTNGTDKGAKTYAASSTFVIAAGPKTSAQQVAPNHVGLNKTITVTAKGSNFNDTSGMSVRLTTLDADGNRINVPGVSIGGVAVSKPGFGAPAGTADTATFDVSVGSATPGTYDLVLMNAGDRGTYICAQCFGIDSLSISPSGGSNGPGSITALFSGSDIAETSDVRLVKAGNPAYQPALVGTWVTGTFSDADARSAATFNLENAAPGLYNAIVTIGPDQTLTCTACFSVFGQQPTVTAVAPLDAGQGALNRLVTITGTKFSRGMIVDIGDLVEHDVTFVSPTQITVLVDVPSASATGMRQVVVTNADGAFSAAFGTKNPATGAVTGGFTVTAGPVPTAVADPAPAADGFSHLGQGAGSGATKATVKVTGTGFTTASTLDLGPGITITKTTATATDITVEAVVAPDAPLGAHSVTVVNPDGGRGVLNGKFTINAGPVVTSVSPFALAPGATQQALTVLGTGFVSGATLVIPDIDPASITNVTVNGDGTQLAATVSVPAAAAKGLRSVTVINTDKGENLCPGCFAIATPPSAPRDLTLASGARSLTAQWFAPSDNGGAPITGYLLTATDPDGVQISRQLGSSVTSHEFTELTNGDRYTVVVRAINGAGPGSTATATGTPGVATVLSLSRSASSIYFNGTVRYTGYLTAGSTKIAGRTVALRFTPASGSAFTQTLTTSSTGLFDFTYKASAPTSSSSRTSPYNLRSVVASFAGDSTYQAATSRSLGLNVAPRVVVISPSSSSSSRATTTLTVYGGVSPNKPGKVVYLYKFVGSKRYLLAKTTVNSSSRYYFRIKPGRGTYNLRVYIPATTIGSTFVNTAAFSPSFKVVRT